MRTTLTIDDALRTCLPGSDAAACGWPRSARGGLCGSSEECLTHDFTATGAKIWG